MGRRLRIEKGRSIAHAAADHMADRQAAPAFAHIRPGGIAGARRLEPDESAIGRGDANRTAAIGAVGHGHHAGGDGGGGPAAGAARAVLQIPGVARRTVDDRLGRRVQPELRRVGAAEDDQAGMLVALDESEIVIGNETVI